MKIRSAILTEMSGKLGGAVGSRSRGGVQYLRKLVTPANPRTTLQSAVRSAMSSLSVIWQTVLTEAQQIEWIDRAEGTSTGQTLFVRANQQRRYAQNSGRAVNAAGGPATGITVPVITAPPTSLASPLTPPGTITIDDSANNLVLDSIDETDSWNNGIQPAGKYSGLSVFVSQSQSVSRNARQFPYQLVAALVREPEDTSVSTLTVNLAALGIPTVAGRVHYVRLVAWDKDGGVSIPFEKRVTVVA